MDGEEGGGPVYPGRERGGYIPTMVPWLPAQWGIYASRYPVVGAPLLPGCRSRACTRGACTGQCVITALLRVFLCEVRVFSEVREKRREEEGRHNEAMTAFPGSWEENKPHKTVKTRNINLPNKTPPFNTGKEQNEPLCLF